MIRARRRPPGVYKPFRLFFPAAALWALAIIPAWLFMRSGVLPQPTLLPPALWHAEEMLFGYTLAVIAGYLLPPLTALPLAGMAALWLIARAVWFIPGISEVAVALMAAVFPIALGLVGVRRFGPVKRARNHVFAAILIGVAITALVLLGASLDARLALASTGLRLALFLIILLIIVMGGRLIPAATLGALREQNRGIVIRVQPAREIAAILALTALLITEALALPNALSGVLAWLVAALLLWRMKDWHSFSVGRLPEIWPLHLGYAWIAVGFGLLGMVRILSLESELEALHALGVGGVGTITLAMMARLARLRSTRRTISLSLNLTHGLFAAGVALRVAGPWAAPTEMETFLWLSAVCWSLAYARLLVLFVTSNQPSR